MEREERGRRNEAEKLENSEDDYDDDVVDDHARPVSN